MIKRSEKDIQNEILAYLDAIGADPFQIDSVGIFDPIARVHRKRVGKYHKSVSDIIFFYGGKTVFCEVKTPDQYKYIMKHYDRLQGHLVPSKERYSKQLDFLSMVTRHNQVGFFCDGLDTLIRELGKL